MKNKEQYKCQSYYNEKNVLQDCTCGKCEDGLETRALTQNGEAAEITKDMQRKYKEANDITGKIDEILDTLEQ